MILVGAAFALMFVLQTTVAQTCKDEAFCEALVKSVPDCSYLKESEREKCPKSCQLCTPPPPRPNPFVIGALFQKQDYVTMMRLLGFPNTTIEKEGLRGVSQMGVNTFYAIPYALPPLGFLRFQKPVPHPGWVGVRDASAVGYRCPQDTPEYLATPHFFNEDCLTLNIFAPDAAGPNTSLPVLLFIHGGSLRMGSGSRYESRILARQTQTIVVTMNYRLGLFGFLSSGNQQVKGNYGLWDQRLAIQWVKKNIRKFGGNPDAITLVGHSAGSRSIGAQILSPWNNASLFQQVVMLSGFPRLNVPKNDQERKKVYEKVLDMTGCNSSSNELECLRSKSAEEIVAVTRKIISSGFLSGAIDFSYGEEFLPGALEDYESWATSLGQYKVMIGLADVEGSSQYGIEEIYNFTQVVKLLLGRRKLTTRQLDGVSKLLHFNYKQHDELRERNAEIMAILTMVGDEQFNVPATMFAEALLKRNVTTYMFRLNHEVQNNFILPRPAYLYGRTMHSDVATFFFGAPSIFPTNPKDTKTSFNMMELIGNFVKTGNPNHPSGNRSFVWDEYDSNLMNLLDIENDVINMKNRVFARSRDLWEVMVPYTASDEACPTSEAVGGSQAVQKPCADLAEYNKWKSDYTGWLADYRKWKALFVNYKKLADEGRACRQS